MSVTPGCSIFVGSVIHEERIRHVNNTAFWITNTRITLVLMLEIGFIFKLRYFARSDN